MDRTCIAFVEYSYNRYSIAVLTGVLEEDERLKNTDIRFIKGKKEEAATIQGRMRLIEQITALTQKYDKLVVAFSFHTPNISTMATAIGELRRELVVARKTDVLLIAGGPHPSGDPFGTLKMGVDVVVVGEGEATLPTLLVRFFSGEGFEDIKGLSLFDGEGNYLFTGRPAPIDLSDYPPFAPKHKRFSPIEISRGCPWGCKFCQTPFFMGGKMRHRSIESIVKYAKIAKDSGLRDLRFITPVSFAYGSADGRTVNIDALEALLEAVSTIFGKKHVYFGTFPSEVRPESVTMDALALIKKYCANDNIIIGAQSGSDLMLRSIHRGHGAREVIKATRLIIEAGFVANVDFIFGLPGETPEDIQSTLDLIQVLTNMGARIHGHAFMPLVGTPLSDQTPGVVDPRTVQLLTSLRGRGLEFGQWQRQEKSAKESSDFLAGQKEFRPN